MEYVHLQCAKHFFSFIQQTFIEIYGAGMKMNKSTEFMLEWRVQY